MEDKESVQGSLNDQTFIYFIEVHDKSRNYKLILNPGIKSIETEILEEKEFSFNLYNYIYKVHRIKILKEIPEFELSVQFKGENENIYERKIKKDEILLNTSHIFLFNFQPANGSQKNCFSTNFSDEYPLSYFEQFKIYLKILKEKFKIDRNSKECQDCMKYTMKILIQIEYEFIFYLSVFAECFDTEIINELLKIFKTEKLSTFGEFSNEELNNLKDIINKITQEPNLVLEKIIPDERPTAKTALNTIILIFDLKFQKEKLKSIKLDNDMIQYIFSKYYHLMKLFDFNDIKDVISLTDDCFTILFLLGQSRDYLLDKFNALYQKSKELKEEKKIKEKKGEKEKEKENDLIINVDKFIIIKDEDKDLSKILIIINSLIDFQKEKKVQFITFSPNLFESMTKLINDKNIEHLFSLKQTLKSVKQFETSSKYNKIDIDKILDKILNHSFISKNFDLFKNKCENLIDYLYKNDKYLDEYAIELIRRNEEDDEFWNKRKEKKIKHDNNFINNACSVVTSLDQFNKLFEILCEGKEGKDFIKNALISIQKTFFNICKEYTNEKLMDYLDIISLLIYKSDLCLEENIVEKFLEELEKNLSKDFIVQLYIKVLNKYKKLNINIKIKINNFLEKLLEPEYIAFLVKDLNENSIDFVKRKLTKYIIKEKEFFNLENSNSMKILILLKSYGAIPKKDSPNIFLKETYKKIESIRSILKNNDFTYVNLNKFFKNEKENYQKLIDKISLLSIIDNKEMINDVSEANNNNFFITIQQSLENKYREINEYIDKLSLYRDYLLSFKTNQNEDEFMEIVQLIGYFKDSKINELNKDKILKIKDYENKFGKMARQRIKYKESLIFVNIKEEEAESKSNKNDEAIINESIKKFEQTGEIFKIDGFDNISKDLILIYLKTFKSKNENGFREELEKVMKILNIEEPETSIDEIVNTLKLFSKKEIVIEVTEAVKNFIDQTKAIQKEYTGTLNSIIELKENNFNKEFLKMSIEILKALGIDIMNKDNYFIDILLILKGKPEVIEFLLKKNVEECGLLYDTLDNNDFLKISDIIDLEKCVEYMNSLGSIEEIKQMKDYELIEKAKTSNLMSENLKLNFINFIEHFDDINRIIQENFDKSEASRQKINYILLNSYFQLSTFSKNFFEGFYKYNIKDEKKKDKIIDQKINLNELQELRDRAILTINPLGDTNENIQFIDMVSNILKLFNLLNEIYNYGYTKLITIIISSKNYNQQFSFSSPENLVEKSGNIENMISILRNLINNLKENYKNGYKNNKFLRFIYGRQFNNIYNYLNNIKDNNISPFLKFITNNELENIKNNYKWKEYDENEFQNVIDNCCGFIKNIFKANDLSLEKIYKKTLIKKNTKLDNEEHKGFYVYSCTKVEKEIIQLYIFLTGNTPIAQNILLCNKKTSNEEITAFLYRAIFCEFNSCFIIGGIEYLKFNQKNFFIEILNQILNEVGKDDKELNMKSCLIILSSEKSSDIYKSLDSIKYKKTFNSSIEKYLEKIKMDKLDKIEIITSDKAGIGKSTKIKKYIEKAKKDYIYFPLGGVFTRNDILQRLKQLKIKENSSIHLDLYDTDCIDLMMDFLFWILIGKLYKVKEDIFYLLKNTEIFIEIPNGFINFFAKFPILDLIPQKPENKLSINKLEPLIVSKKMDSKVQIVCNYLKLFNEEQIDEHDLNIPGITLDGIKTDNRTLLEAKALTQEECEKLIFETIKENNKGSKLFNYYQVHSFIDVLADEFIKFNQNYYISANNFLEKQNKNVDEKKLRSSILEGFIKHSIYFTQGAFTKLINEQKSAHKMLFGQYDENEDNRKGINDLAKDKHFVVSFDKIDPSLVFFHEGNGPSFSYITNKKESDEEYQTFLALFNSQTNENFKSFPDYKNKEFNFLPQIKLILSIDNPLTNEEKKQKEINEEKMSLEEIANDFVFTSDNFIKMILMLLRLRANIPVIMMGETGCGKTALIKKLSELKNNGDKNAMKILNIHAGTTDNDIIEFIKKITPDAEKLESKENKMKSKLAGEGMIYEKKKIWGTYCN